MNSLMMKKAMLILTVLGGMSAGVSVLHAEGDTLNSDTGIVRVCVKNEDGTAAVHAPVYITNERHALRIIESDAAGAISIDLPQGTYAVSSAQTHVIADSTDRYTSSIAQVLVHPKDNTTIVLTLHLAEDAISGLSLSALKKIGVADEVSKYTN